MTYFNGALQDDYVFGSIFHRDGEPTDSFEVQTIRDRFGLNHKVRYKEGSFSTITELSQVQRKRQGKTVVVKLTMIDIVVAKMSM